MVDNKERIVPGFLIISLTILFFIFDLDIIFFLLIICSIFYDFFYSKILKNKDIFYILISFLVSFSFLNHFNINLIYLNFLFLLFLITSLYFKNYIKQIFILLIFLYLFNFYEIINNDRKLIFIIIFISFINDTSAYLIGNYFKGPLIIPKISPKKNLVWNLRIFFYIFFMFYLF